MFEAALLVCLAVAPKECHNLVDTEGPYLTKKACEVRVDDMAEFAVASNLFELDIKWKCTAAKGLKT